MDPIDRIEGLVAPYPFANVDTDQIVPGRFMSRDRREGYGEVLFHDLRFDPQGAERPEFLLNRPSYRGARILVTGANFGCGSSRECAVWALLDRGFRCVLAPSFSDIFRSNAVENGLLAVELPDDAIATLQACATERAPCTMAVSLSARQVHAPGMDALPFDFDPEARDMLMRGHGRIDATLLHRAEIDAFERDYRRRFPWSAPPQP
jgi:3-isopropylmalate/(R)-2-methylmalate dehydratase small subunit